MNPKFKVGDRVRVLRGISESSRTYCGQIGRILEIKRTHAIYAILDIDKSVSGKPGGIWLTELVLVERNDYISYNPINSPGEELE